MTAVPRHHWASDELELLDALRRVRWVVQAAYFAGRLASHDLTGVTSQGENERGLADACGGLAELGVRTA